MAAHESLGEQFITNPELRNLHAGDWPTPTRVGDLHSSDPYYRNYDWKRMHQSLDQHGMKKPLTVIRGGQGVNGERVLSNGHHRAIAALDRGMMFIPHHDEWDEGGGNYHKTKKLTEMEVAILGTSGTLEGDYLDKPRGNRPQHKGQGKLF